MSEPRAIDSEARFVDAAMLLEITLSASAVSSGVACTNSPPYVTWSVSFQTKNMLLVY
jgi:hypothetical protein